MYLCSEDFGRQFETGFLCVTLTVLELALQTMLAMNSQRATCLCLQSAGITGTHQHCHHLGFLRSDSHSCREDKSHVCKAGGDRKMGSAPDSKLTSSFPRDVRSFLLRHLSASAGDPPTLWRVVGFTQSLPIKIYITDKTCFDR